MAIPSFSSSPQRRGKEKRDEKRKHCAGEEKECALQCRALRRPFGLPTEALGPVAPLDPVVGALPPPVGYYG